MALLNDSHATIAEDQKKFWADTLQNTRILFFELDKAIYTLTQEERKTYSMNTGDGSNINVTFQDVPSLIDRREKLKNQIEELEEKLGIPQLNGQSKLFQGVPGW